MAQSLQIFLLALLFSLLCVKIIAGSALDGYPPFNDISLTTEQVGSIGHPGRLIINGFVIGCNGFITTWELFCDSNGSHPIEFHVWRGNISTTLNLVGRNVLPDARPDDDNLLSYSVPPDQQIQVQPGDFVGIRSLDGIEPNPFRIQGSITVLGTIISYSIGATNEEETPAVLDLNGVINIELPVLPVMQITVVEDAQQSSGLSQPVIIAIAVSVSMAVAFIVLAFVFLFTCCCLIRDKRKGGLKSKPRAVTANVQLPTGSMEMEYNRAYDNSAQTTLDPMSVNYSLVGGEHQWQDSERTGGQNDSSGVYYSEVADVNDATSAVSADNGGEEDWYEELH